MNNQEAQNAYASAHARAMYLLELLQERIEDADAPTEKTHWGHVGDMAHLVSQLEEIVNPEV